MNKINFKKSTDFGFQGMLHKMNLYIDPTIDININISDGGNGSLFDYRKLLDYYDKHEELNIRLLRPIIKISIFSNECERRLMKFMYGDISDDYNELCYGSDLVDVLTEDIYNVLMRDKTLSTLARYPMLKLAESREELERYIVVLDNAIKRLKNDMEERYEEIKSLFMSFYIDTILVRNHYKSITERKYCKMLKSNRDVDVYSTSLVTTIVYKKGMKWSGKGNKD